MIRGIARKSDSTLCVASSHDVIVSGSSNVFCNGLAVARLGDKSSGHENFPPTVIDRGSGSVFCNGLPVARLGDTMIEHQRMSGTVKQLHTPVINSASNNVFCG